MPFIILFFHYLLFLIQFLIDFFLFAPTIQKLDSTQLCRWVQRVNDNEKDVYQLVPKENFHWVSHEIARITVIYLPQANVTV